MRKTNLMVMLLMLLSCAAGAQLPTVTMPAGYTDTYPLTSTPNSVVPTSCHSMQDLYINGNYYDGYVSGWTGKVVWRIMQKNTYPPVPYSQGEIAINGTDVEVGILNNNNVMYLQAAYLKNGGGFVLDRYIWNGSNFVFFNSVALSTNFPGKKINMDMYGSWETAIVWSEYNPPTNNYILKCRLARGLDLTQSITLNGTETSEHPDIALSKHGYTSSPGTPIDLVAAHIVYTKSQENATGHTSQIYVSVIPFIQVFTTNPAAYTPVIADINDLGQSNTYPRASIDCPDISNFNPFADWAYVYNSDHGLEMRLVNQAAGLPPTTKNLVNGADYGNTDISAGANTAPAIAYSYLGQSIHAGWMFNAAPFYNYARLVALEITRDGSSLISPPDYQLISTNATAASPQFSKNSFYTPYLYATFSQNSASQMRHVFHVYGSAAFKGHTSIVAANQLTQEQIGIAPNPFADNVRFLVPSVLMNEDISVTVTDMLGRKQFGGVYKGEQLENIVQPQLRALPAGTYLLNSYNTALGYNQQQKIVKAQ